MPSTDAPGGLAWIFLAQNMRNRYLGILTKTTNQFFVRTIGAAPKTQWRTSGAANTWISYWGPRDWYFETAPE